MAVQTPFFGKRDNDAFGNRSNLGGTAGGSIGAGGSAAPATVPGAPASRPAAGAAGSSPAAFAEQESGGSKLTVGPNIKLKGVEITDCDTLVVEGTVEATMDSRVIQIAQQGAFHGTAEIDIAEIRGVFDGTLTVREKLVIYGTGKVSGKIRYGKVVIEEGGELSGQIEAGTSSKPAAASSANAAPAVSQPSGGASLGEGLKSMAATAA